MKKIIVTGGHLTPALAVIDKLLEEKEWEILFIGRKHTMEGEKSLSLEAKIIPRLGIRFVTLKAGRIQRRFTRWTIPAMIKIPLGFFQALWHLVKFRPNLVISFGGYLSTPVVVAGWLMGVPVITHEQAVVPGLANKINALFARKIAVSWKETLKFFPKEKVVFTGNPIRKEIIEKAKRKKQKGKTKTIYITGGNQGAHVINEVVRECLPILLKKYRIIHQCGTVEYYRDYERLLSFSLKLSAKLRKHYRLKKWFDSWEVAEIFSRADLVVSRSGANTVTELAFLGKPAILIPLPFASAKEQLLNAKILKKAGTAEILLQDELSGKSLIYFIEKMIKNLENYQKKAQKAKRLVQPNAAERILKEIKKLC